MKVTTKTMMLRALTAALLAACTLPALAQDRERWRDQQREEKDEEREERQERRRERQEQRGEASGEAARQNAAAQEAVRVQQRQAREQQQQQRQDYQNENRRAAAEQLQQQREAQERVRNERQQQRTADDRSQQLRQDEARRVQQERQERYGYGNTRDGNRDWDDGNRRGGDDRDNRYAGGDRDRDDRDGGRDRDWDRNDRDGRRDGDRDRNDRDGRRDGGWDRDGRNDRRWDQNAQRRYDNWQRDADRYRREAMQRHNANRYAALQQQRRMSQYRYQQDYWERQRRWYSGWNTRRFDRDYIFAPVVYRYSRGGRWYDVNRYAAETLQQAIRIGYAEGARAGEADRYDGWRGDWRDNFVYQDADFGYDGYYVSLSEYQYYFREGFRRGYEDAYGRRYRYGRHSGGEYIIAAAVLDLILNLQDY